MFEGVRPEARAEGARGLFAGLFPNLIDPPPFAHMRREFSGALACLMASVPQSMAYGAIAVAALGHDWVGLGIVAGLLGAVSSGFLAALLGANPSSVTGPRAATCLVFAATVAQLVNLPGFAGSKGGPLAALGLAEAAVVLAGMIQIGFAALRLGRLSGFIPYPVVAGFLNGSALLILLSQVWTLTGIPAQSSLLMLPQVAGLWQPGTLALGLGTAAVMLVTRRLIRGVPPALVGLALGTLAYHAAAVLGLAGGLGGTVSPLPAEGLPSTADLFLILAQEFPADPAVFHILVPAAFSMAALSSLDALLACVALDALTLRRSDGNREMAVQGFANLLGGLLWMLPSSGSTARSVVLVKAGSRSALGPLLTAAFGLLVVVGLGSAVAVLPRAVLAGLLVVVALDLFDKWTLGLLRRGVRNWPLADMLAVATVVAATLAFNLVVAVGVGVALTLVVFVVRMARSPIRRCYPATALTARIHGDPERTRFLQRFGASIAVIEVEGALFFGSVAALEAKVEDLVAGGIRHVVLDLKRVKDADATGARVLERLHARLTGQGGALVVAYVERERRARRSGERVDGERRHHGTDRRLWRVFAQLGAVATLGVERFQPDVDRSVALCEEMIRAAGAEAGEERAGMAPAIMGGLDREAVRTLRSVMRRLDLAAGQVVFAQGDPPDAVYFLASGKVDVTIDLAGTDRKLRVQTLAHGSVFGEMAVLAPKPRSATVAALEPSVCHRLAAEDFEALKHSHPDLAFRLLENIALIFAERLRATNLLLAELEG
ncbi:MAG TPA: SulP family inorganic anion transporter [Magnetospirillum sp.]|nr:SulP family inorganic anion transporter [Magnetospirillum sp.]